MFKFAYYFPIHHAIFLFWCSQSHKSLSEIFTVSLQTKFGILTKINNIKEKYIILIFIKISHKSLSEIFTVSLQTKFDILTKINNIKEKYIILIFIKISLMAEDWCVPFSFSYDCKNSFFL